jgi:fluoride exporter
VVIAALVAVCGGLGALARFVVDDLIQERRLGSYPLGTLVVNLVGSLLLGIVIGAHASHRLELLVGTATLGSYTTFSTWIFEAHRAAEDGQPELALGSIGAAIVVGLAVAALGRALGEAL